MRPSGRSKGLGVKAQGEQYVECAECGEIQHDDEDERADELSDRYPLA